MIGSTRPGHEKQIASFLTSNPDFLERYVLRNVDLETLERWTIRRASQQKNRNPSKTGKYINL